jgi:hypothetical protein
LPWLHRPMHELKRLQNEFVFEKLISELQEVTP